MALYPTGHPPPKSPGISNLELATSCSASLLDAFETRLSEDDLLCFSPSSPPTLKETPSLVFKSRGEPQISHAVL